MHAFGCCRPRKISCLSACKRAVNRAVILVTTTQTIRAD
jgi:hypothetical protein